jgi:HPt (histidine-containing phosphotransfer) domain-containing protein
MEPLRSVYEDDPNMAEIVREFASELGERVEALETCLGSGDYDQLRTLAHQLKGAGGGYGYPLITESCAALEQALKDGLDEGVIKERTAHACEVLRAVVVPEA